MSTRQPRILTIGPLLQIYLKAGIATGAELGALPVLGSRFRAILAAQKQVLSETFLDQASAEDFGDQLAQFYGQCVFPPLHEETVRQRAGFLRHGLIHLLRSPEPLRQRTARFLSPAGPYFVAGLGPMFWSALFQGLEPLQQPGHLRGVVLGLKRLGLFRIAPGEDTVKVQERLRVLYQELLAGQPKISALHLDHFLCLAAGMQGRDLWSGVEKLKATLTGADVDDVIRAERSRFPLRRRVKERGQALSRARAELEAALHRDDPAGALAALGTADLEGNRAKISEKLQEGVVIPLVKSLWQEERPPLAECLQATEGGLGLPAAVLHLREPKSFFPWSDSLRQAVSLVEDGITNGASPAQQYSFFNEAITSLCRLFGLHYLEAPGVLAALAGNGREEEPGGFSVTPETFAGFCPDTFHFLEELGHNNNCPWMSKQRDRYQFVLRQPLAELAQELAARHVEPVLNGRYQLDLETSARTGKALSSICKNNYGRSVPYQTALWITFCRRMPGGKKKDAQFFVRVDATGVSFGLRLGREVREAGKQFRRNVQEQAELLWRALGRTGALARCRFAHRDDWSDTAAVNNAGELRGWASGKTLLAGQHVPADSLVLKSGELVGEIILTFEALLPAYLCAVQTDPRPLLEKQLGAAETCFTGEDFSRRTLLDPGWLFRAQSLLGLKRQLILQGVPGTSKTFVAKTLARWLTADRPGAVRLVQFHPAYSYEEFVEGIKAKSVETNGRHEVTYPVEDGVLCEFAARAARSPAQPFVLIIDEINRGNLPRIFGELLYLLEYREQSLVLPYSRRQFRLPANLYLIGTMNAADRSVALIDQALRRRFSFLEMPPSARLLAAWLAHHPPAPGQHFAAMVVELFEQLNKQLLGDLGPLFQVGHSYFMAPELDEDKLQIIWQHQVRPLLEEYFAGQPGRAEAYQIDKLLQAHWRARSASGAKSAYA